MSKPIIEVKGISKRYKLGTIGAQTMRDEVEAFFSRFKKTKPPATSHSLPAASSSQPLVTRHSSLDTARSAEFWALRDVSFDVQPGEVVGIIGRNGAGKSTLLKILSRITEPTSGEIRVRGRIASLLEVGTGFHPELSGRENIFLNGAILGMSKAEIRAKFDEIVDFAGVEQFIDTPVKRYSSGMYVRLAFAVAAHLEPEILIVDEVLAVGDAEFQKKCLGKMKDVAGHGRTILFVSHQIPSVTRLCNRVIWMEKGGIKKSGPALDICNDYLAAERPTLSTKTWTDESSFPGNSWVRLESVTARGGADDPTVFPISQPLELEIGYQVIKSGKVLIPNIHFYSSEGALIFVSHDWQSGWRDRPREVGFYTTTFTIPSNFFCEGTISVTVAISSYNPFELHTCENEVVSFTMLDDLEDSDIRGDYTGRIPGLVRPLLNVETKFH